MAGSFARAGLAVADPVAESFGLRLHYAPDEFWKRDIDFHIYEKRERANVSKDMFGFENESTMVGSEFRIRIAKAKALDKARKKLIEAIHKAEVDAYPPWGTFSPPPSQMSRFIDNRDVRTPNDIRL